jgi:hypothetical protein
MYSISLSLIVVGIGILAAYFIDSKRQNHDMYWLGWIIFPLIYGAFSVQYGAEWAFSSIIELFAGVGLYHLFFHAMFKKGTFSPLETFKEENKRYYQRNSTQESKSETAEEKRNKTAEKLIEERRKVALERKNKKKG